MDRRPRKPTSLGGIYPSRHDMPSRRPSARFSSGDLIRARRSTPISMPEPATPAPKPATRILPKQHLMPVPKSKSKPVTAPVRTPDDQASSLLNMSLPNLGQQGAQLDGKKRGKGKNRKWLHWSQYSRKRKIWTSILVVFLLLCGIGGWYGFKILNSVNKVFHGNLVSDAGALFGTTPLKGESSGRVNILVAGDSADDPGHNGANLTDSIMVLSIDTKNNTAFMLSVPRDLWVQVPTLGHQKVNAANEVTSFNQSGYPSGGMGQLEEIVQSDLGIPIDYYALVNYTAFKDAVDAVGGVSVTIQTNDPRGIYDANTSLKLPNGEDLLTGQQALNLARARGDGISYGFVQSDYDRTQHQRQLVTAIAKKATSIGVLTNPSKVSQLFGALGNNVVTDLTIQNVLRLAQIGRKVNINSLGSFTYNNSGSNALLTGYTDPSTGQEALIPKAGIDDFAQLQQYYQQLTSSNPVVKEGATVTILNGSDVTGLAKTEETALQAKGATVSSIASASAVYPGTMLIDNSNGADPQTKALLQQMFPGTVVTTSSGSAQAREAEGYSTNFVVVLGQNWDKTSTTTAH